MKAIKYILYTFGILAVFIAAQPARAFEISPVKLLFTVDPGANQTAVIKIKNTEKNNLVFKLDVLGVRQDEEGRPVIERGIDTAESWVYPENNLVNIKSGEIKSVNFIIKTPADALAGSHYLGLAVEPVLEKSSGSNLTTRLVSLLTLQVKGMVEESVLIEKWTPLVGIIGENIWKFDLGLKNNGTIEVLMKGTVAIRNWRGEEIFSEPVTLGNKFLAGSKRVLHPEVTLKNNISLPGLYSAQIKINYGLTNQAVSSISYVWYFPQWSKIVLASTVLFLALFIFWKAKMVKQ